MRKLGKYEVLGELGHGSMGVVYRARDPIINRPVALKTITTGLAEDPNLLQRFYREAQSAGGLQHPNIVTIYDMGDEKNLPYIAMELIEGESLDQLITRRTNLPAISKLTYIVQACQAFDYAHKRGIVHRDIKPGNVMVNKDSVVKVVDFGIARVLDTSKTQTGMLIGTFAYMSPEQYQGERADERSDIWSFGVLVYELLCYQKPFTGDSPASLMLSICQKEPRPLLGGDANCPPEMEAIVSKMLQKSPLDRYQSMEDVLLDLDPIYKDLRSRSIADLVDRSGKLIDEGEFSQAQELLRDALKLDSANMPARGLLEKVNAILKRLTLRPKALQHIEKGRALLEEGRIQEARSEVENAVQLDPTYEPAQELMKRIQEQIDRAQIVSERLQFARQLIAEGRPAEAEALISQVLEIDASNKQAIALQRQAQVEKEERQRRLRFLEKMQEARRLWNDQDYEHATELLVALQEEFPGEEDVQRLLETVREDQAERYRRDELENARNLFASNRYTECKALLLKLQQRFPNDEDTSKLLEDVRLDETKQQRLEDLAEARRCIASGQYQESIDLLSALEKKFSDDGEVSRLLKSAREGQSDQKRQQEIAEARNLLAVRRYDECTALLSRLREQFPDDATIPQLLDLVQEGLAEQRKENSLAEVRNLLNVRRYQESIDLLASLEDEFSGDEEIPKLLKSAREGLANQKKQQGIAEAGKLLDARRYEDSVGLLTSLENEFSGDQEIARLLKSAREGLADRKKQQGIAEARKLLAARRYQESIDLLASLEKEFLGDEEILKLARSAREGLADQKKQQGIAEARNFLNARRYQESVGLLTSLENEFSGDKEIPKLLKGAREGLADQKKQQGIAEARKLLDARRYEESVGLLTSLENEFSGDKEIPKLVKSAREGLADQKKQRGMAEARNLLAAQRYDECTALLGRLQKEFPGDAKIRELQNAIQEGQADQRKQKRLTETRNLLNVQRYEEAIPMLAEMQKEFPHEPEISRLLTTARDSQLEHRKQKSLTEARRLLVSRCYEESASLLTALQNEFPKDAEIARLLTNVRKEQGEHEKQQKLATARDLLSAQRLNDALELLEALRATYPSDTATQKLYAVVKRDRDKQITTERLQGELDGLKKLISEKKYSDVLSRAEALQTTFPANADVLRLIEFARSQQSQIESETRLRAVTAEMKELLKQNRFADAIAAADAALKMFPDNAEIFYLREQAEVQNKKQRTRSLIEQRIRDIRFKINREDFSDAVDLAKQTLAAEGPDTEVTQLLNSALVEWQAREKKRQQEVKLQEIRGLVSSGNIDQAAETLFDALQTHALEELDPRVSRISHEIELAKNAPFVPASDATLPANFSKEYAWAQAAPTDVEPIQSEPSSLTETWISRTPAIQPLNSTQPVIPEPAPQLVPIPIEVPESAPLPPVSVQPERDLTPLEPRSLSELESAEMAVPAVTAPSRFRVQLIAGLAGIAVIAGLGVLHFKKPSRVLTGSVLNTEPAASKAPASPKVVENPADAQQRGALEAADRLIASNDLSGALQKLQDAEKLNGSLTPEIKSRETSVTESMGNRALAKLRQDETVFFQQAQSQIDKSEYDSAKRNLEKILALGPGGVRKPDAQKYLNEVIPQRQKQEGLLLQAKQAGQSDDLASLQKADDLFGQVQALGGPRKDEAAGLQRDVEAKIAALKQAAILKQIQTLEAAARQDILKGDLSAARQKAIQIRQLGGDPAPLEQDIDKAASQAESQAKAAALRAQQEQQQQEQQLKQAEQAEIARKAALDAAAADERAVRSAVQRFLDAFSQRNADALREAWPAMPQVKYQGYKTAFEGASAISLKVTSESVKVDGSTATVSMKSEQMYMTKTQKPMTSAPDWRFQLNKGNGVWTITDVQ